MQDFNTFTRVDCARPAILLIGNCIVDLVWTLDRYPAENTELRATGFKRLPGGNACNSASILRQLGHPVDLVAQLAEDELAGWIRAELQALGIGQHGCPGCSNGTTPVSSIWLNQINGSRTITHFRDLPELSLADLRALQLDAYGWVHFEGRNIDTLGEFVGSLKGQSAVPMSLELEKPRPGIEHLLPAFELAIVSAAYLAQLELDPRDALQRMATINPACRLVCTLGERGLLARDRDGQWFERDAVTVERVVDSNGAGDCFIAATISRLAQGAGFADALDFAQSVVADKIQRPGLIINPEWGNE